MTRLASTTANTESRQEGVRPEIQGLRAIAVLTIVLFHIWPWLIPGGYVGVDVFFVISGFLITSLLVREAERSGRIALGKFYWRRAWRLLPMAFFVVAVVAAFAPVVLPPSQWRSTGYESLASALSYENWWLAAKSVDYFGAQEAPSPLQHYWSLSVEEQFYIMWPALVLIAQALSRITRTSFRMSLGVLAVTVTLLSLAASILLARGGDPGAYFATHARIWEFGIGALLSIWPLRAPDISRRGAGFVGVGAILAASLLFSTATPFPGFWALLPTVGAALVITSDRSESVFSVFAALKTQPVQLLGDVSYSAYLWHWPLIIFYRMSGHDDVGFLDGAVILAATLALSIASKRYIEDRYRHFAIGSAPWRTALLAGTLVLLPVAAWSYAYLQVTAQMAAIAAAPEKYIGARALVPGVKTPAVQAYAPPLALLRSDTAEVYRPGCHSGLSASEPHACRFGDPHGKYRMVLVGDSHAANWIPALEVIASRQHWNATSYTKSACSFVPIMPSDRGRPYESCLTWVRKVLALLKRDRPDVVIITYTRTIKYYGAVPEMRGTLLALWRGLKSEGMKVIVIADTPEWPIYPDVCLYKNPACSLSLGPTHTGDWLFAVGRESPSVSLIDMNDYMCPKGICPVVIGNVVLWRDRSHLTATYVRTLIPFLEAPLLRAVAGGDRHSVKR